MDLNRKERTGEDLTKVVFICEQCRTTKYGTEKGVPRCHRSNMKRHESNAGSEGTGSLDHIHW